MSASNSIHGHHAILLIGAFAMLFYSFGLAVGGTLPHGTGIEGVAGVVAAIILLVTVFAMDSDRPLLDDGSEPPVVDTHWWAPGHSWPLEPKYPDEDSDDK